MAVRSWRVPAAVHLLAGLAIGLFAGILTDPIRSGVDRISHRGSTQQRTISYNGFNPPLNFKPNWLAFKASLLRALPAYVFTGALATLWATLVPPAKLSVAILSGTLMGLAQSAVWVCVQRFPTSVGAIAGWMVLYPAATLWPCAIAWVLLARLAVARRWRSHISDHAVPRCPRCDYILIGNISGRCPECGTEVLSSGGQWSAGQSAVL